MQLATKNCFGFEPKMAIDLTETGTTATPEPLRPTLGSVANLTYKPGRVQLQMRLDATPTTGAGELRLKAGDEVLYSRGLDLAQMDEVGNSQPLDLTGVQGQAELYWEVEITEAADNGASATLDAWVYVEQPLTIYKG